MMIAVFALFAKVGEICIMKRSPPPMDLVETKALARIMRLGLPGMGLRYYNRDWINTFIKV